MALKNKSGVLVGAAVGFAALSSGFGSAPNAGAATIIANSADNSIQGPNGSSVDGDTSTTSLTLTTPATSNSSRVGSVAGTTPGRVYVMPFLLPDFGNVVDPFTSASLTVTQIAGGGGSKVTFNADLYGLTGPAGTSSSPNVVVQQYYEGASDTTNATLVQDNFFPMASATTIPTPPQITTTTLGSTALLNYLNFEYDTNGANSYVFLRLNPDADSGTVTANFGVDTAEAAAGNQPTITYTAVPEPASLGLAAFAGLGLSAAGSRRRSDSKSR